MTSTWINKRLNSKTASTGKRIQHIAQANVCHRMTNIEASTVPEISCVVPFFNEETLVGESLERISKTLSSGTTAYEIIAVDDGSNDATWKRINDVGANNARIRGVRLSRNFGKEGALSAGIATSRGAAVIVIDGDLQHPPEYIPDMIALWRDGYQLVSGVKTNRPDQGPIRRLFGRGFNKSFGRLTGVDLENSTDFRLMDRAVVDAFLELTEVSIFFRGATTWLGFSTATVPIEVAPRPDDSGTKWSLSRLVRMGLTSVLSFTSAPLHIVTLAGIAYIAVAFVLGIQTLLRWATGGAITGFTTVILLVLATGGLTLVGLGIIGEYIARIFDEVKRRPRYIVREHTNGGDESSQ